MSRTMERLTFGAIVALGLAGCFNHEQTTTKAEFPQAMAEAACGWAFRCCDTAELSTRQLGATEAACVSQLTTTYATMFAQAETSKWKSKAAQELIDEIEEQTELCPRAFSLDDKLAQATLVESTAGPGDSCTNRWECSTKFCRGNGGEGTCANPLELGKACKDDEPCKEGLRCVSGICSELKVDGSACTEGDECISGACGGGKCVVSTTYTCDGK